jgi:hypothetical protein
MLTSTLAQAVRICIPPSSRRRRVRDAGWEIWSDVIEGPSCRYPIFVHPAGGIKAVHDNDPENLKSATNTGKMPCIGLAALIFLLGAFSYFMYVMVVIVIFGYAG